ncbi:MAG TPA: hypothetical protein VLH35_06860, partial [Candidatus Acidoferrales bacterium]|nr:hypothetical protein [Candidatus Acidoferrales bacterium]
MPKNPIGPFWYIREGDKIIQCTKEAFDKAITEGKSVKYNGYPNMRMEKIADILEASRMQLLSQMDLPTKYRAVLTNPSNVVQVEIIEVDDPDFWIRESKNPKYQNNSDR